jgi:hypothetical protein
VLIHAETDALNVTFCWITMFKCGLTSFDEGVFVVTRKPLLLVIYVVAFCSRSYIIGLFMFMD